MIKNIRHAAIVVSDLNLVRDFYESFLGFILVKEDIEFGPFIDKVVGLNNVRVHWVKLKTPNGILIEILKYIYPVSQVFRESKQFSNQLGHSHLAFTVENIDDFVAVFQARGGVIVNKPEINPEKTAKVCYIHDPEYNLLEIVEELKTRHD